MLNSLFRTHHPPPCPASLRPLIESYGRAEAAVRPERDRTVIRALQRELPASGLQALPAFWPYALGSACAARWLAEALEEDGDLAFATGLWQATGLPVLHAAWPQALVQLDRNVHPLAPERWRAEQAVLGVHHGDVSAELARRWGFAESVVCVLSSGSEPQQAGRWAVLAAIVQVAVWRTRVELLGWGDAQARASCPVALGRWLSVPLAWCPQRATLVGMSEALLRPMPAPSALCAEWGASVAG